MANRLGSLLVDIVADTSGLTTGLEKGRKELATFGAGANRMGADLGRLRGPATALAVSLTGVSGAVGSFGSTLASLVAGGGPVAIGVGLVAAAALGWKLWRKEIEETRAAAEKFTEQQLKAQALRLNPNADLIAGIDTAKKRLVDLDKQLADLRNKSASQGLGGDRFFGADITKTLEEITKTTSAIESARVAMRLRGDEMVKGLAIEAGTFGMSTEAVKRYAVAMDTSLTPAQRKAADVLLTQLEGLGKEKKAREAVADAVKKQVAEQERLTAAIMAAQRAIRIEAAGGGNRPQGFGGSINQGALSGGLLSGSSADEISESRGNVVMKKLAKDAELWRLTTENAIRGIQSSFADLFANVGRDGLKLGSLLTGVAQSIQRSFAELAAAWVVNSIFGGALGGLGGGLSLSKGNLTQSQNVGAMNTGGMAGVRALTPPRAMPSGGGQTYNVAQSIVFNVAAMDGASVAAMLQSQKATIAHIVAQASSEAPRFAAHIVRNGLR